MPTPSQLLHDPAQRRLWFRLLLLLAAVVAVAAFTPGDAAPSTGIGDKFDHLLAFGSLAVAAALSQRTGGRAALATSAGLLLFGAFIEIVQTVVPGRHASWADLAADALGIAGGLALAAGLRRCWPARQI